MSRHSVVGGTGTALKLDPLSQISLKQARKSPGRTLITLIWAETAESPTQPCGKCGTSGRLRLAAICSAVACRLEVSYALVHLIRPITSTGNA